MTRFDLEDVKDGAERVVSFELKPDLTLLEVVEECDTYFGAELTKAEVGKLITMLQELHAQMVDV